MDNQGWIKLHRKHLDNPVSSNPKYLAVWIHILLMANHEDKKIIFNNETIVIKRGSFISSVRKLAKKTNINPKTLHRIIKWLKNETLIETQTTNKFTVFTVLNWDAYQKDETQNEKPGKHKGNTKVTQGKPNNNDNNDKNNINLKLNSTSTDSKTTSKKPKHFGNEKVNHVLKRFVELYGFEPTDPRPRYEAYNLVRRFQKFIKETYQDGRVEDRIIKLIDVYFNWVEKQDWSVGVQKLGTIRRKTNIFFAFYKNLLKEKGVVNG